MTIAFALVAALAQAAHGPAAPRPTTPSARAVAPETFLVDGAMLPDRGPDRNTVSLVAPTASS